MTSPFDSLYAMPYYPIGNTSYSNQVFLNDMTGMNWYTPPYNMSILPTMPLMPMQTQMPYMSFNDSIFNYSNPMTFNMPYPQMNYDNNGNNNYYQNMNDYYTKMMENQVKYQKKSREADISLNAAQRNMRQKGLQLHEKIELNEQDQIMPAFNEYIESVRSYYGDDCDENDLKNTALQHYEEQFGKTIQKDIRENGDASYVAGVKQAFSFLGLNNKTTAEENVAKITGQPEGKTEKNWKAAGTATVGAVTGATIGGFAPKIAKTKALSTIFKGGGPTKWKVCLAAGTAIGAAFGWIYSKAVN